MRAATDPPRAGLALAALGVAGAELPARAARPRRRDADAVDAAPLPQGNEPVELDPADFTVDITNPYWPMEAGRPLGLRRRPTARATSSGSR